MKSKVEAPFLRHIAIIMDGNGRWAKERGLTRTFGHENGVETIRRIVEYAGGIGLKYLSLFAFSSENWKRPRAEVDFIMRLLTTFCKKEAAHLRKNNCRVRFIGLREGMPDKQLQAMDALEAELRDCTGLELLIYVNYGSRNEMLEAVRRLIAKGVRVEEVDEALFTGELLTAGVPDPDLLIRTSGEMRISNYLLWQISYSELYFTDVYWPDFDVKELEEAIEEYYKRNRRFGAL